MAENRLGFTILKTHEMAEDAPKKRVYRKHGEKGIENLPVPARASLNEKLGPMINPENSWERQPHETLEEFANFLEYKNLGLRRTVERAFRKVMERENLMISGQPIKENSELRSELISWKNTAQKWEWEFRARQWDESNYDEIVKADEEYRRKVIAETIEQHKEGWELFRLMSLESMYEVDDNGEYVLDEKGRRKLKKIDDPVAAARVFKQATLGERTALGIPSEILVMSENEIRTRYIEIQQQLKQISDGSDTNGDEVIDADFEDSNGK